MTGTCSPLIPHVMPFSLLQASRWLRGIHVKSLQRAAGLACELARWSLSLAAAAGKKMVGEADIRLYLDRFDKKYWATYKVSPQLIAAGP